jgi:asparagine synthase (glutamine-hydrolysing)
MCGITGYFTLPGGRPPAPGTLRAMNDAIRHRGPDDEGFFEQDGVGLGMRRLAIIDLAGGHQPMTNEDGSIQLIYNGEIYNYQEARERLIGRGARFRTHSDTETVVKAYEDEGEACLQRFRGMYAFALWDARRRRLLLVRDRLGKKPIHLLEKDGTIYFGSEIKSFAAAGLLAGASMDPVALYHYLMLGYTAGERTIWQQVRRVPEASLLALEGSSRRLVRYWDLPPLDPDPPPVEASVDRLAAILDDAVRLRLIADVPVGGLLSGGVDSSLITALMARHHAGPVKTFTIGFDEEGYDESGEAARVAALLGTEHREQRVRLEAASLLPRVVRAFDEPFADTTALPQLVLSELARREVTVALSGDGGDELFCGYRRYRRFEKLLRYRALAGPMRTAAAAVLRAGGSKGRAGRFAAALEGDELDAYLPGCSLFLPGALHREAAADLAGRWPAGAGDEIRAAWKGTPAAGPRAGLEAAMAFDVRTYLVDDILAKVDRTSMACSLEVRVPLLDHLFVEAALALPASHHVEAGRGKRLLRAIAARVLPAGILDRPKHGFTVPVDRWFRAELAGTARDLFSSPDALTAEIFPRGYARRLLEEHVSGRGRHGEPLWSLLLLELWHREAKGRPAAAAAAGSLTA